jgi:hypothetical protein
VVRQITEPDATHDAEVLPMYVIRFEDGVEIEAFPDEVEVTETEKTAIEELLAYLREQADGYDRTGNTQKARDKDPHPFYQRAATFRTWANAVKATT